MTPTPPNQPGAHSGPPRPELPILARAAEIAAAIRAHQVVVICGQTGSGKTTQLPQICHDLGLASPGEGIIAHTQPRRLAARAVASRIAEERGVRLGGAVGVKVRFDDQTSRDTAIKVMTDGMLLAELAGDPDLRAYRVIIIDEAHERSLNIDFLIGCLRELLPRRPDLKVIITSATIDPARFSAAFGGDEAAPVIEVSGRMFPVEVRYRPGRDDDGAEADIEAVADAVEELSRPSMPTGDVLVFLPGEREIRAADAAVRRRALPVEILPLFSRLSNQEQDRIFHPVRGGPRRIILATNIAETSLTVPGIRYVVDSGLARINRYDAARKVQGLPIEPISRASAEQRAGRCGRVASGVCIRLYSEASFAARPAFTDPEIRRSSLANVILQMKSLGIAGGRIEHFRFLDPPDPAAVRDGYETLFELGAIDAPGPDGALTPIGRDMARVPLDARIARMLLAADREGALAETLVLAAALEVQDPRQRPMGRQEHADRAQAVFQDPASDFLTLLRLWDQFRHAADALGSSALASWCHDHFLSPARMREWTEMAGQLRRIARELGLRENSQPAHPDAIHRSLLTGLITHAACREGDGSFDYRGVRGNQVQIFPGSVLFKKGPKWIMAAEIVQTTRLYARTVARIEPEWIEELAGHMFRRQITDPHLDAQTGEPSAWERITMSGIVVVPRRRIALRRHDHDRARAVFIRDGLVKGVWKTESPFAVHNAGVFDQARTAEAKLRRRGASMIADDDTLAAWFDQRIPEAVCDPESFSAWYSAAAVDRPHTLMLSLNDVLAAEARAALADDRFPDVLLIEAPGGPVHCPLAYALAPGKDEDGLTVTVPLIAIPHLPDDRLAWGVPGMLPEIIAGLVKTLPRAARAALEARLAPAAFAEQLGGPAGALTFAAGDLPAALSEAAQVLFDLSIPPDQWKPGSLPAHLRPRIRIIDDHGKELAIGRDLAEIRTRLAGRLERAHAAAARARFRREGIRTWDFGDLAADIGDEQAGASRFPTIVDSGDSVRLTLIDDRRESEALTALGTRRLLALACGEEIDHALATLGAWPEMARQYAALGTPEQLRRELAALIADRAMMLAQPAITRPGDFESRVASAQGRLTPIAREVGESVARTLEARFRLAQRLSGGTPRLWAESVADIREHAAYLMPRGFLGLLRWERVQHYPRFAEVMRGRLFGLREEGSRSESAAFDLVLPRWKRFTGWVARAMADDRADGDQAPDSPVKGKSKAPLPPTRRSGAVVNVDAGEWAMRPGVLPPPIERYRWMLEDLRVAAFGTGVDSAAAIAADLDKLWLEIEPVATGKSRSPKLGGGRSR